jgi:crotonobetainyl-CoA:carnitine CoA-transferase CaiB-like acyl-CoA transferase
MSGPLTGIKVIEIGTLIAAPFAARMMAEFGAEVIKIEAPVDGDPIRKWRKLHEGTSLWWYLQSRNKKSISINLKSAEGVAIVKRLAEGADVLIENLKPGALEKLGLGWDVLHALNPKLTMVRISGYGQTGPYKDRPGFGAIGEAMGGIRYTTGEADGVPARAGISLGDSLASLHAVMGALMSVLRVKTGQGMGQMVDVSLVESVFNLMESLVPEYDLLGHVRERSGGALPGIAPRRLRCHRRQQQSYFQAPDAGHRPARPGGRPGLRPERRPRGAIGAAGRGDFGLDLGQHHRQRAGRAGGNRRARWPHLLGGRHRRRSALPGARHAAAG